MASETTPTKPLIIDAEDGLALFSSLSAARGYIEVPDVEDGVYGPAFDAEGRLVAVSLPPELFEKEPSRRRPIARLRWRLLGPNFNSVSVELVEEQPNHRAELIALLQSTLKSDVENLEELVAAAVDRFGVIGN